MVASRKNWKNHSEVTAFNNISKSSIKESPALTLHTKNQNAMKMRKNVKLQKKFRWKVMPHERYPPNRICSTKIYWKNAWIVWIDLLFKPYPFSWERGLVPWAHLSRPKPAYDRFVRFCTIHRVHRTHTTISATLVAIGHIWHPAMHGEMRGKTNITQKQGRSQGGSWGSWNPTIQSH